MAAYSYYEANQYEDAVGAAQRFIELHPGNKDVPYAYYLMGISYYEQISDVGRDQEMTQKSAGFVQRADSTLSRTATTAAMHS